MNNKCGNCANYIQHFAILDGKIRKIWCGHCMENKKKKLHQDLSVCDAYVPGEPGDNKLVNREYLTKALLNKILSLDLWQKENE